MSEFTTAATARGDAISQLVGLALRNAKLSGFDLTGRGHEDIQKLANYAKSQHTAQRELWTLVDEILKHPLVKEIIIANEEMQAHIAAHVLRARGCIELNNVFNLPKQ